MLYFQSALLLVVVAMVGATINSFVLGDSEAGRNLLIMFGLLIVHSGIQKRYPIVIDRPRR